MPSRSEDAPLDVSSAAALRREISARNLLRAAHHEHETTYGSVPSVVYQQAEDDHGNFFPASYRRILANPAWAARLDKTYTASSRIARGHDRIRAELDCANSSDALLMNIFCHPRALHSKQLQSLLNIEPTDAPDFGVRVRTPLRNDLNDRTEIDMQLGDLLVEAKLSETNFQTAREELLQRYEAFEEIFDTARLPRTRNLFRGYQLLRGALAAHHHDARYAVLCDARRPDLREQWFQVIAAIHSSTLRSRMLFLTWQEIAATLPRPLQNFLEDKYGIAKP